MSSFSIKGTTVLNNSIQIVNPSDYPQAADDFLRKLKELVQSTGLEGFFGGDYGELDNWLQNNFPSVTRDLIISDADLVDISFKFSDGMKIKVNLKLNGSWKLDGSQKLSKD